jgi:hypothetical protein
MTYDEFSGQLNKILIEYRTAYGKDMENIHELKLFLDKKLCRPKRKGLKSLKGLLS